VVHDRELVERLDALPRETFSGEVFRATRVSLDPLASSYSGGRWMRRDAAAVLYTSCQRDGALAEIAFHWSQLTPRPTKPVVVHTLRVVIHRTLRLIRADLATLGVPESVYNSLNPPRTQEIGAAAAFLGCDGLITPSARWPCDNLVLLSEQMDASASVDLITSETVDWAAWATDNGMFAAE